MLKSPFDFSLSDERMSTNIFVLVEDLILSYHLQGSSTLRRK